MQKKKNVTMFNFSTFIELMKFLLEKKIFAYRTAQLVRKD